MLAQNWKNFPNTFLSHLSFLWGTGKFLFQINFFINDEIGVAIYLIQPENIWQLK